MIGDDPTSASSLAPTCTLLMSASPTHLLFHYSSVASRLPSPTVAFDDGSVTVLAPGTLFHVGKRPHDSWVVGDEPYVSLHFLGAESYAR
jgi:hypothetical protein